MDKYFITLKTNEKTHGLFDKDNNHVETGFMRSFLVPKYKTSMQDVYNHIQPNLNMNHKHGIIKAKQSEENHEMNVYAIFQITTNSTKY